MAGALRPVVLLMLFASLLFMIDGLFDGVYPGGPAWFTGRYENLAEIAYVFAILNTVVALMVARGSERGLQSRIALSVFFIIERPLTAFVLGPKPIESVVTHFATAGVELVILLTALRVWRLGHSLAAGDVDMLLSLESLTPAPPPDEAAADGLYEGFVPGGRVWSASGDDSGWLVYLFAAVALIVAVRAVYGGKLAMRALIAIALILFVERSFSPFVLREQDPVALGLHAVAAFVSLALALATAGAIRAGPAPERASVASLEAA
ncbi:MAG: hypothetical protein AUH44_00760 [Chloroflexi bacterium 13_1_40CM_68_15]|nr:MAG: hypothetical protein AUH44_00760 [Chloroflexi bacterium 13_1_40CM_68_15]